MIRLKAVDLLYTTEHEWVWVESSDPLVVRIGITDYAQAALGDVVYVELPIVGSSVEQGDRLGELESTKAVSEVAAPVRGTVRLANESLASEPSLINAEPLSSGWFCSLAVVGDLPTSLLSPTEYLELLAGC